jgi:putative transposase
MRKAPISYGMQSAQLKVIRRTDPAFQAVGAVKVKQHRPVPGTVKALQLKREHRRWYLTVIIETEPVPLPRTDRKAGVHLGVARFLTTSDGQIVANPRFLATSAEVIANLERRKARARPAWQPQAHPPRP